MAGIKEIFAQLPADFAKELATNAGIVCSAFNPSAVPSAEEIQRNILFATSGGVTPSCIAELKDRGEGIDNCPLGTAELQTINKWTCKLSGTAVSVTGDTAALYLGSADKTGSDLIEITPRQIKIEDFKDLWFVCPYGEEGGFAAIQLKSAYSTSGLAMQTEDKGNGKFTFEFTGFPSLKNPEEVPFKFYLKPKASLPASEVNAKI